MIEFYSGTPGSGKSYHMAKDIWLWLRLGRSVISTVNVDTDYIAKGGKRWAKPKRIGSFTYKSIMDLTPEFLYEYAFYNHKKGREGQTLLIIDECQILFNPREYHMKNRSEWVLFFTKHRHLGYKIIMTSQFDRLVDRQIRSLFEIEIKHRKINNFGFLWMLPMKVFIRITYWHNAKMVMRRNFSVFRKKYANIYDSYVMFDDFLREKGFDVDKMMREKEQRSGGEKRSEGEKMPKFRYGSDVRGQKVESGEGELDPIFTSAPVFDPTTPAFSEAIPADGHHHIPNFDPTTPAIARASVGSLGDHDDHTDTHDNHHTAAFSEASNPTPRSPGFIAKIIAKVFSAKISAPGTKKSPYLPGVEAAVFR